MDHAARPQGPFEESDMTQTFDTIFRGGIVVNQDGEGARDVGVSGGRIAAIGDLSKASAGEIVDCTRPAHPARRDRHPGAFPRARRHPQGRSGIRVAQRGDGRRHRRVRNAEYRSAHHHARGAGRQGQARAPSHALRLCVLHRRHLRQLQTSAGMGAAARLLRRQGVHGLVDRLAAGRQRRGPAQHPEGDPPPRLVPCRGRGAAERAQVSAGRGRSVARIRSGATRKPR